MDEVSPVIGIVPFRASNDYIENTKRLLGAIGPVKAVPPLRAKSIASLFSKGSTRFDVIVVNWLENKMVSSSRGGLSLSGFIKFFLNVIYLRMISRKIIFVRHNNYPHGVREEKAFLFSSLLDFCEKFFAVSVTHSRHNECSRRVYVPHPLYRIESKAENITERGEYFLVFGRISPYKGIGDVISHFPSDVNLVIAGPCEDDGYLSEIRSLSEGKCVTVIPEFLDENEAGTLVSNASGLILAHTGESMIVSGSYFYAISHGACVYALSTPFLYWLKSEKNAPGLVLMKGLDELPVVLENNGSMGRVAEKDEVISFAEDNFSDREVVSAWRSVFTKIGLLG